jgi:hypothetical protein
MPAMRYSPCKLVASLGLVGSALRSRLRHFV